MPAGILFILALAGLATWTVVKVARTIERLQARGIWWITFAFLATCGPVAGLWSTFAFEYQASERMRIAGFPVPMAFFHLEDGNWIDFIPATSVQMPGIATDLLSEVAVCLLPLWRVAAMADRRGARTSGRDSQKEQS
jgi:hypothetical protein